MPTPGICRVCSVSAFTVMLHYLAHQHVWRISRRLEWRRHGRGRRLSAGLGGATRGRASLRPPGNFDTTCGLSEDISARSMAAIAVRDPNESRGVEKTRTVSPVQAGHGYREGAVPMGQRRSMTPSYSHRYWYNTIGASLASGECRGLLPTRTMPVVRHIVKGRHLNVCPGCCRCVKYR